MPTDPHQKTRRLFSQLGQAALLRSLPDLTSRQRQYAIDLYLGKNVWLLHDKTPLLRRLAEVLCWTACACARQGDPTDAAKRASSAAIAPDILVRPFAVEWSDFNTTDRAVTAIAMFCADATPEMRVFAEKVYASGDTLEAMLNRMSKREFDKIPQPVRDVLAVAKISRQIDLTDDERAKDVLVQSFVRAADRFLKPRIATVTNAQLS